MSSRQHPIQSEEQWQLSRKSFIRTLVLGGVAMQLPWLNACSSGDGTTDTTPLTGEQYKTLQHVLNTLFPAEGDGPGALECAADKYVLWVLRDSEMDQNETRFVIDKIDLFRRACRRRRGTEFYNLDPQEQTKFVEEMTHFKMGKKWLSRLLTLTFEAVLLHPIYGGNTGEVGWKWLEHDPGSPRAIEHLSYPKILKRRNEI